MAFLANAFFQAALLKYVLPNQPEVYINMNNVDTFEVDRAKNTVYLYYRSSGAQAQTPNQPPEHCKERRQRPSSPTSTRCSSMRPSHVH